MNRILRLQCELVEACQKINDHSDPDLGEHGVGSRTEEPLDLGVLLDAFEEQFDLPAGFVNIRDRSSRELEVVGQKHITLPGFRISISDAPQLNRTLLCGLNTGKLDRLIAAQTLAF